MSTLAKWILGIVCGIALVLGGILLAGTQFVGTIVGGAAFRSKPETLNTQITNSFDRTGEVALLSLGIQGIEQRKEDAKFFGVSIPGTERALFLQYEFTGKLGVNGADVAIEQTGEKRFTVHMPEFVQIGVSNPHFEVAVENNGVLSLTTPAIDIAPLVNGILNDQAAIKRHIEKNRGLLKEQAQAFYGGIIHGIDPDIELKFEFDSTN